MLDLSTAEVWFVTGSQHLYGPETLETVARDSGEIAAGLDIPIFGIFSIYPQARYVGQNFKYEIPGVTNNASEPEAKANYMTFDLGLSFHNPLSARKR